MWVLVGARFSRSNRIEDHVEDGHRSRSRVGALGDGLGRGVETLYALRAVPVTRISHVEGPTML
jgi:hypothetical protein